MNGKITIRMIHPALAQPDMSRRSTSAKTDMNIQMTANQKKKMSVDHRNVPNVQCTAYLLGKILALSILGLSTAPRHHPGRMSRSRWAGAQGAGSAVTAPRLAGRPWQSRHGSSRKGPGQR